MIDKTELYYSHESIEKIYFILKALVEVRNLRIIDCEVNKFWINQIKNLLKNLRKYQLLIFAEN